MSDSPAEQEGARFSMVARAEEFREEPSSPPPLARAPWWTNPFAFLLLAGIWGYQRLYPRAWKRTCIYQPTCSIYMRRCVVRYGIWAGVKRGLGRIRRCNGALYRGGLDEP